jgi:hypothetical protein
LTAAATANVCLIKLLRSIIIFFAHILIFI